MECTFIRKYLFLAMATESSRNVEISPKTIRLNAAPIPMGVKVLLQKRTVAIITFLFWVNTFTPMGLHSSGYGMFHINRY